MPRVSVTVLPETATAVGVCAVPATSTEKALVAGVESSSSASSNVSVSVARITAAEETVGSVPGTATPVALATSPKMFSVESRPTTKTR